ncbi:MAG: diaminopimelate epimerase, partial [Clostridia bacterium]|nr:diaminopimelate epimerase [Clostridia bacterium]
MEIKFTKMHGCANDYIYVNCFDTVIENPNELSMKMSPRHFSVGSDGLVLICPSNVADAKMRMFNLDGSEGKMCGNAIRCIGKYLYDNNIVKKEKIDIETLSGIKHLSLNVKNGKVDTVRVDMGIADIIAKNIPVISSKEKVIDEPVLIGNKEYKITCVSMGNPHAITYVNDTKSIKIEEIGPLFEKNEIFPENVNTEFIKVIDRNTLDMRVWERG